MGKSSNNTSVGNMRQKETGRRDLNTRDANRIVNRIEASIKSARRDNSSYNGFDFEFYFPTRE